MLINVKLPTIFDILTFNSMMNATSEDLKARKSLFISILLVYEQVEFHAQLG